MDITSIATAAVVAQRSQLSSNVQIAMLKSSIQSESNTVLQLLEGATTAAANPPHLGNLVDTSA
jgi:hypothetical protein